MADTKWSQFPSATDAYADDEVVGLKNGQNARFSFAKILALIRQNLSGFFIPTSQKGAAGGVAELDNTGKVPSTQLPPIASTAADVTYDNTQSGLTADDVQEAIDELAQGGGGGTTVVANPSGAATDVLNKLQVDSTIYQLLSGGTAITFPGFSTTERVVGTWDGYPLYAKIVHQTLQKVSSAQRVTVSSENIVIHLMLGTSQTQNEYSRVPLPYNGYLWAYQDGYTQIVVSLPNSNYNTIDFLLVYTKPSDSPAPTPGGIPGDSVSYDPTTSGMTATDVQAAVDELADDKANQSQLATVETSTTASRAYTVGECFTLNGVLYECTYPISSGGTITVNTNCKVTTVGDNLVGRPSTVGKAYFDHDTGFMGVHLRMKDETHQLLEVHENVGSALVFKTFNGSAWAIKWSLPLIMYKEVVLTINQIGTSFNPTARLIGDCNTLFGIPAGKILAISIRDAALSPASILLWGIYSTNFYLAASQQCTLSSNPRFLITYIP